MSTEEIRRNTGDPLSWGGNDPTQAPQGDEAVRAGVGEVHSSEEPSNDRGVKGPQFPGDVTSGKRAESGASLPPQIKLWELQETLHAKAKGNPKYRFYALYDKLYRQDVLTRSLASKPSKWRGMWGRWSRVRTDRKRGSGTMVRATSAGVKRKEV